MSDLWRVVRLATRFVAVFVFVWGPLVALNRTAVAGESGVGLERVAAGLVDPLAVRQPPEGTDRLFVVEKIGRVRIIEHGQLLDQPFLDMTATTISNSPEQGMYDLAFHPAFARNGLVYISHTEQYLAGALVVWEYRVDPANPNRVDPASRRPVIAIQRRAMFHNGGSIAFGPDGYLYVGVGEGRPYHYTWAPSVNLAQSLDNLDGKILRIDVDVPRSADGDAIAPYLVPDNPFGGPLDRAYAYRGDMDMMRGEIFPEIWALGLRNPWRFEFDRVTGDLFIPDVGEFDREEVNWQPASSPGGENYGWDAMEGTTCNTSDCSEFVKPIWSYSHDDTHCAVIGLGVSRASNLPGLAGSFIYSDFCDGEIMALSDSGARWTAHFLLDISNHVAGRQIAGGGSDQDGNVYVTTCTCASTWNLTPVTGPDRQTGAIWKLVPFESSPATPDSRPIIAAPSVTQSTDWKRGWIGAKGRPTNRQDIAPIKGRSVGQCHGDELARSPEEEYA